MYISLYIYMYVWYVRIFCWRYNCRHIINMKEFIVYMNCSKRAVSIFTWMKCTILNIEVNRIAPLFNCGIVEPWHLRIVYFHGISKWLNIDQMNHALRKLYFHFTSHWMGYDRGDSFLFDFEPNGFPFGSKSKGKLSPWSYLIQYKRRLLLGFLPPESLRISQHYGIEIFKGEA